jgi:type I restriction enzyme S subunit
MLGGLRPYPDYCASHLPWAEKIPTHWEVRRNARLFAERNETGFPDLPILEVSIRSGVTVRDLQDGKRKQMMTDRAKYKRAVRGDIAYNMMRMWQGAVGAAPVDGLISPAYVVAKPLSGVNTRYYSYLFRTRAYMNEVNRFSRGIVADRNRLYWDEFRQMPSIFPPTDEQVMVANFLDSQAALVAKFVRTKRRQIELLNEQRRSITREVISGRLLGSAARKQSGLFWLPDLPSHWSVRALKYEFECLDHRRVPLSGPDRATMGGRNYDYYGASGVIDRVENYIFDDDLLLIAEDGANLVLRNLPLVIVARGKFWVNNHAHILKPKAGNLEYLSYLLEALDYRPWITGAAQPKLTLDRLMSIKIPVPPMPEQDSLVQQLKEKTSELSAASIALEKHVACLREYWSRLVADVVTGKIDVRGAQIDVLRDEDIAPDVTIEEDALDELEEMAVGYE